MSVNLTMDGTTYENATKISVGGKEIQITEVSGGGDDGWTDIDSVDGMTDGGTQTIYGAIRVPLPQSQTGTSIITVINKDLQDTTNALAVTVIFIIDSDGNLTNTKQGAVRYKRGTDVIVGSPSIERSGDCIRFNSNSNIRFTAGTQYKYRIEYLG